MYCKKIVLGAKNHTYFIGFLACLVMMCIQILYGMTQFWQNNTSCNISSLSGGFWKVIVGIGQCDPWVAWVSVNALLHLAWVTMLLVCQIYQVFTSFQSKINLNKYSVY